MIDEVIFLIPLKSLLLVLINSEVGLLVASKLLLLSHSSFVVRVGSAILFNFVAHVVQCC